jgi:murein DD-endopeptidase MepM/ murein hydrolase activator NlpD
MESRQDHAENHERVKRRFNAFLLFFSFFGLFTLFAAVPATAADYPRIRVLSSDDPLFVQHQAELEEFYRASEARLPGVLPPLSIFEYRMRKGEDLFSLNARLGLPYDTLATLNAAASREAFDSHRLVLIANQAGLFVNDPPRSALEDMLLSTRLGDGKKPSRLVVLRAGKPTPMLFFPAEQFTPMERLYFLGVLFEFPIPRGRVTSMFGIRRDPFTGRPEFHTGIDIGAPEGTGVHAARDGEVSETGSNDILGNYVVIDHPGGYQTVYGHLSVIGVTMNERVTAGAVVGAVGRTGRATGPHLHFEVKRKGRVTDPFPLLAVRKD